jgi:hypothetical protein
VIQSTNPPAAPVKVRFYFSDGDFQVLDMTNDCPNCTKLSDAYAAGITEYNNAPAEEDGSLDNNKSGIYNFITPLQVDVIPFDIGYYAEFEVTNFSEFWISSNTPGQSLPLLISAFTVNKIKNTALLQWLYQNEFNTGQFVIERSTDGINYIVIGSVPAGADSASTKQYRFTDEHPATGINYYRIKLADKDGKFNYSPVRKLSFADFAITLNPNPVTKGMIYITSTANCSRILLHDATGRLIKTVSANGMAAQLPVQDVSKGLYFITVVTDNGSKVTKVFIE